MRPSFNLAILASGSVGLSQSAFDSFLPLRLRSSRTRSSAVGVSMPLSLGHARQHLAIAFAAVAPNDRAQRRVGFHRRGIDADPLALDQAMLGQTLEHPGEDLVVDFERQAASGAAQPRVIRHSLALAETQELSQRKAVSAAPFQATLAVDAFEVADQQHAEVAARRQRRAAATRRILLRALRLNERVEARRDQHCLQLVVEHVSRRARHLRPRNQHVRLPFPLPSKSHPPPAFLVGRPANQTTADFVNGLLTGASVQNPRRLSP